MGKIYASGVDVTEIRKRTGLSHSDLSRYRCQSMITWLTGCVFTDVQQGRRDGRRVHHYLEMAGFGRKSRIGCGPQPAAFRLVSSSGCAWRAGWRWSRRFCWVTSRPLPWTRSPHRRLEKRLLELKDQYTIVLVTHVLRQARRLADHVIFMYRAKLWNAGRRTISSQTPPRNGRVPTWRASSQCRIIVPCEKSTVLAVLVSAHRLFCECAQGDRFVFLLTAGVGRVRRRWWSTWSASHLEQAVRQSGAELVGCPPAEQPGWPY